MIIVNTTARVAIVTLSGEFDLATAPALRSTLDNVVMGSWKVIAVECADVSFIDIAGAKPLLESQEAAVRAKKRFVLLHPRPNVATVLELMRLGGSVTLPEPPLTSGMVNMVAGSSL